MAKFDISVVGFSSNEEFRVAASATRVRTGEPVEFNGTYSSGVANANVVVAAADGIPIIGTDNFVGISARDYERDSAGTVIAHKTFVSIPIAHFTKIRGKAKVSGNVNTDTELLGLLWDFVLFDLTGTTYTIDETAAGDTSGLIIRNGNITKGTLDVVVDARIFRADIA